MTALGKKNPANRSADDWAKLIVADGKTLKTRAATKSWTSPRPASSTWTSGWCSP